MKGLKRRGGEFEGSIMCKLTNRLKLPILLLGIGLFMQMPRGRREQAAAGATRPRRQVLGPHCGWGLGVAGVANAGKRLGRLSGPHQRSAVSGRRRRRPPRHCRRLRRRVSALGLAADFRAEGPAAREQYVLRSHPGGLYVIGAGELAVRHAVWDLLYRLGHRQFFPGPTWEIIPSQRNLSIAVGTNQRPDYLVRNIWYGHGVWDL